MRYNLFRDICDVSEAGDAGTRNDEGINWYVTVSHQAARASLSDSRVSLSKEVGGSLTSWKRLMETSRRGTTLGTTTKGLANEEDTGVWLASVADADDEGRMSRSPLMIRRAMTRAIPFTSKVGVETGMNLDERCMP